MARTAVHQLIFVLFICAADIGNDSRTASFDSKNYPWAQWSSDSQGGLPQQGARFENMVIFKINSSTFGIFTRYLPLYWAGHFLLVSARWRNIGRWNTIGQLIALHFVNSGVTLMFWSLVGSLKQFHGLPTTSVKVEWRRGSNNNNFILFVNRSSVAVGDNFLVNITTKSPSAVIT